jgi:putative phage-type endonuclease
MSEQGTQQWFNDRKGRVTGSVAGAILGLSPYMKPSDVMRAMVREYHGAEREFVGNVATEYGSFHEKFAIMDYEMRTGNSVQSVGFIPFEDWLGASPDGLIDDDGLLEAKCPYGIREHAEPVFKTIQEQPHYYAQVQIELFCTQRKWADFYQWTPHGDKLTNISIDMPWLDANLPKLRAFYDRYLVEIKEPDRHLCDRLSSAEAMRVSTEYASVVSQIEALEEQKESLKERLIEMADGQKTNIGDLLVYPVNKKGSVSYAKVVKDLLPNADLSKYTGAPTTSWTIKC